MSTSIYLIPEKIGHTKNFRDVRIVKICRIRNSIVLPPKKSFLSPISKKSIMPFVILSFHGLNNSHPHFIFFTIFEVQIKTSFYFQRYSATILFSSKLPAEQQLVPNSKNWPNRIIQHPIKSM